MGQPDHQYEDILLAADTVRARLAVEPGVVDVDYVREAAQQKLIFVTDKEKAALHGVTTDQIAGTLQASWQAATVGLIPKRDRAQSSADSTADPDRSTDQRGGLRADARERQLRPTRSARRTGTVGVDTR